MEVWNLKSGAYSVSLPRFSRYPSHARPPSQWCNNISRIMQRYKDVQTLIKACGHDTRLTSELDHAIKEAQEALLRLDLVQEQARCRFKANGICSFVTVDECKRKEIEHERAA